MEKQDVCTINRHLAVLGLNENSNWTKEANFVSWYNHEEKLDIREWSPDHSKCGRGVTLTIEEAKALKKVLNELLEAIGD